jgi:hypothetical protein
MRCVLVLGLLPDKFCMLCGRRESGLHHTCSSCDLAVFSDD